MIFDGGIVTFCELVNSSTGGLKPVYTLSAVAQEFFGERTVGYNRYYTAKGVNEQIDKLIRVWENTEIRAGMYAVIDSVQYRITEVQMVLDDDGLRCNDISLSRLESYYDVSGSDSIGSAIIGTSEVSI